MTNQQLRKEPPQVMDFRSKAGVSIAGQTSTQNRQLIMDGRKGGCQVWAGRNVNQSRQV
jgi:hypothetical protein